MSPSLLRTSGNCSISINLYQSNSLLLINYFNQLRLTIDEVSPQINRSSPLRSRRSSIGQPGLGPPLDLILAGILGGQLFVNIDAQAWLIIRIHIALTHFW